MVQKVWEEMFFAALDLINVMLTEATLQHLLIYDFSWISGQRGKNEHLQIRVFSNCPINCIKLSK